MAVVQSYFIRCDVGFEPTDATHRSIGRSRCLTSCRNSALSHQRWISTPCGCPNLVTPAQINEPRDALHSLLTTSLDLLNHCPTTMNGRLVCCRFDRKPQ